MAREPLIQVLVGPRQVGKTTVVQQILSEWPGQKLSATADAVPGTDGQWLEQQWNAALTKVQQSPDRELLLVIEEIQKIDNWSETDKKLWDEDQIAKRLLKVILLGSSRLLIQKGLTESLAGRIERTYLGIGLFWKCNLPLESRLKSMSGLGAIQVRPN